MSALSDEEVDIYRRIAAEAAGSRQFAGTLVCTSYDPKTHSVKGMIMPHGIESGWVPIGVPQTNGGAGHFVGPKVGDAQKLDGDQFELAFDAGDPNTIMARHRMSKPDSPPQVQSGEVYTQDENGSSMYYKQDKSCVFTHGVKGGTDTWDKDGNKMTDTKGQTHTILTGGGAVNIQTGGGMISFNS